MLDKTRPTRREILKKAAFVTPFVLTLPANAAFAQRGSGSRVRPPIRRRSEQIGAPAVRNESA
jgi:hypothetical protein